MVIRIDKEKIDGNRVKVPFEYNKKFLLIEEGGSIEDYEGFEYCYDSKELERKSSKTNEDSYDEFKIIKAYGRRFGYTTDEVYEYMNENYLNIIDLKRSLENASVEDEEDLNEPIITEQNIELGKLYVCVIDDEIYDLYAVKDGEEVLFLKRKLNLDNQKIIDHEVEITDDDGYTYTDTVSSIKRSDSDLYEYGKCSAIFLDENKISDGYSACEFFHSRDFDPRKEYGSNVSEYYNDLYNAIFISDDLDIYGVAEGLDTDDIYGDNGRVHDILFEFFEPTISEVEYEPNRKKKYTLEELKELESAQENKNARKKVLKKDN